MKLRIGVITHSDKILAEYARCKKDERCEYYFHIGFMEKALPVAMEMYENHKVDAIITNMATSHYITGRLPIPIIPLALKNFDVMQALCMARQIGETPAFVEVELIEIAYDLDLIVQLLGMKINRYQFESFDKVPQLVDKIIDDGCDVVVSIGTTTIAHAKERGLKTIFFGSEINSLHAAINEIINIYTERNKEITKSRWLSAIVNENNDGIITIDGAGNIVVLNNAAQTALRVQPSQIIGRNINDIRQQFPLFDYITNANEEFEVVTESGIEYIVSKRVIYSDNTNIGSIIKINELSSIQRMELLARKKKRENGFIAVSIFSDIKGNSACIHLVKDTARKYAQVDSNILLTGESGCGKEIFAQSIHNYSNFKEGPFVAINCTTLTDSLLESELFGYEEGAFTGAKKGGQPGLLELAHNGTLFLDEIGEMPLHLQVKLLRVLQERTVRRIGGKKNIPLYLRFIFATNRNLFEEVRQGRFREDLFYRINLLALRIPPLRERKEDIKPIAVSIAAQIAHRNNKDYFFPESCVPILSRYDWNGNVRELHNFVERMIVLRIHDDATIGRMIDELIVNNSVQKNDSPINESDTHIPVPIDTLHNMENAIIKRLYEIHGSKKKVERILDVSNATLWRRFKEL